MAERNVQLPSAETETKWLWATSFPEDETSESVNKGGKWLLYFDGEGEDAGGLTKQDRAWQKMVKLVERGILVNAKASTSINTMRVRGMNRNVIMCYTRDYSDIDDVRRSAFEIRYASGLKQPFFYKTNKDSQAGRYQHHGHYSVSLYIFSSENVLLTRGEGSEYVVPEEIHECGDSEIENLLPSNVTYKEWVWARKDDAHRILRSKSGGKWIIPFDITSKDSNGLTELDKAWKEALNLVREGKLLTAQCSTPVMSRSSTGVLLCHTYDCEDVEDVKRVAETLREIFDVDDPIYYKTNSSTHDHMSRTLRPNKRISKYKHTVQNQLLELHDEEWIPIA